MSENLSDLPLFAGLSPAQLDEVRQGMIRQALAQGESLFLQADAAARFFVLIEGRLKVTQVTEDGQQFIVRIVHPGELCGFAPALGRSHYPGSAEAMVDSRLLAWPRSRWEPLIGAAPSLAFSAIQAVGRKLDEAHIRLREMSTEEAGRRIAHLLLRLARQGNGAAPPDRGPVEIPFPLTRQDIADMSGNTLHTVSRIMAAWETGGILLRARRKVIIADAAALSAIAQTQS
ncbi:cAMP-binding domain of CRP or a regulatory subunit of cAMP-dependent protein kinases [Paracoccus aminovorans]|uniref:cAMP-binding domain of CRP or a regulatory subunit of cAMP-dependent protein kinases n=1 Tax=Paracoccus aminovorans TaxID=34004 RepID=A0A1I3CWK7_9RHOB|nr:Crp/Fnr family transcriptional regulator [Paracoccus aminovorans]CQR83932.1 Crp/Fnr family transcriptional regulator [Paracoccus aminovorans]SFH78890.1 cAMP-binding domain of CRP or a regulatory subunit of cAMP-dependent protein kinases [Paracoccus aminovorans]